jgi:uncharacterized repeat protein (TIGR01451 family)
MRPSTTDARRLVYTQHNAPLSMWLCLMIVVVVATSASAQTIVNPTTNTILFSGQDINSRNTGPLAGIIMQGTAISAFTGQPVRHLWVADTFASICRMDPELDAPGPWDIAPLSCTYFVNSGGAAIPIGGQFAYDAARHFLYFADNNSASQGIVRIGFDPAGDGGHGALDLTSAFTLGGGASGRKATFVGGTGCPVPGTGTQPSGAALSPTGDLWVGFLDSGDIIRFNSPGTATETGFGSCAQFVQLVATTPDAATSIGLAWIGHDLWSGDGTSPLVIPNADTTCLVPPSAACTTANGTVIPTLGAVAAPLSLSGDQFYPATNGNNLYYGVGSQVAWVGNAAGGAAGQTLTVTYMNEPGINPAPNPPLDAMNAVAVDGTDPANLVIYSAEDPAIAVLPLVFAQGRWWQTTQTSAGPAAPGIPLHVAAVAGNAQAAVSWTPDQVAQPVTSYTVRNSFISVGAPLADVAVNPAPGTLYPPTSLVIPGLTNGVSYAFEVSASNANGTSAFSAQSNTITPPGVLPPSAPTGAVALAGDTQAFVTWTVSASNGGSPITSYTVTSNPGGIVVTVPPPAFGSNTNSTLIGGLTNGTAYTFTVHATNIAGDSAESAPSPAITPSAANLPTVTIAMSGPASVSATPAQLTYTVTVTNTSAFPIANIAVSNALSTVPANIASISRSANVVTVTTTQPSFFGFGQVVTIAGVTDPSFNGTFPVTNGPTATTFTYSQAGPVATSGSGTVTLQPKANILSVSSGQGTCTAGGPGVSSLSCNIGSMAPGALVRINIIVQMQNQSITNSATVNGTDVAGTALASHTASVTTTTSAGQGGSAAISVAVTAQNPRPNVGQAGNIVWTISNTTTTVAQNIVFTNVVPAGLVINSFTATVNNGGVAVCGGPALPANGGAITCTTASLGGSTKNGAKPPQTMIVTVTVTPAAGTSGQTLSPTGTVTFGPGGTDTLPNSATVAIRVR